MPFQLILLATLLALPAWADDDQEIEELFVKYEQVMAKNKKELVPQVFSDKFLQDHGGEKEFAQNVGAVPVPAFDLDIKPAEIDKNLKMVKMVPKNKKGHADNLFLVKRKPTGAWQIEGTISNDD